MCHVCNDAAADFRFGSEADTDRLFDRLVGDLLEMQWHVEAQCLSGLHVDDKLKLCRRLHWQVCWLFALKDAVNITSRSLILIDQIGTVGHQTAVGGEYAVKIN